MELLAFADVNDPWWASLIRWVVMFSAGVLLGLLYRWALRERRRQYMGIGAGISLLAVESIIDHFQRLGEPLSYRVPLDLAAFGLLIASLIAISRTIPPRHVDRRNL